MEIENEVVKRIVDLKIIEFKYEVLTAYIRLEAKNEMFFDKDKIVRMVDILDQKEIEEKIEEKIEKEERDNENE